MLTIARTGAGRSVEIGRFCVRIKIIALNTIRKRPDNTQRRIRCDVTMDCAPIARAVVSPASTDSRIDAADCCSSEACNFSEIALGRRDEPIGATGMTPCNPASGPSRSASSDIETGSATTADSAGRMACTHAGRLSGASDSSDDSDGAGICCGASASNFDSDSDNHAGISTENNESISWFDNDPASIGAGIKPGSMGTG